VRLFLAINIDPDVRRVIVEALAPLKEAAPSFSWTDESRVHLTLKFFGEQDEDAARRIGTAVDAVAERHRPFPLRIGGVGAFPNFRRARVVWLGIEQEPRLELLHHDVETTCETVGFGVEGRAFRPHLTLARVKDRTPLDELKRLSRATKTFAFEGTTSVESIDLMRSNPRGQNAAKYDRLRCAPLRSS
jgi:RNA 2',3'-cyclic 3'-phosphodiesterase